MSGSPVRRALGGKSARDASRVRIPSPRPRGCPPPALPGGCLNAVRLEGREPSGGRRHWRFGNGPQLALRAQDLAAERTPLRRSGARGL